MTLPTPVKAHPPLRGLVAVLASPLDLSRARRLRRPPDLFELRLDRLPAPDLTQLRRLSRPLIITARHSAEGGSPKLSSRERATLLCNFLPLADAVDLELRTVRELDDIWRSAGRQRIHRILSVHDFAATPSTRALSRLLRQVEAFSPDHFKVVTRVDTRAALARLLDFFDEARLRLPLSAMGVGRFGRASRLALHPRGSLLQYVHLGRAIVPGQLSLAQARRLLPVRTLTGHSATSAAGSRASLSVRER